mgnify:FL=1
MLALSLLSIVSIFSAAGVTAIPEGDNPYTIFPSVAKTASINGFADRIYDQLPECAKECVKQSTSNTPCPYWDTGCLCVMPQFGGAIGDCVAKNCKGKEVDSVESLATSICSSAGVWEPYWMIPSSVSDALAKAADAAAETTAESTTAESTAAETTKAEETSAKETTAAETSKAAESSAPAETSKAEETSKAAETTKAEESSVAQSSSSAADVASVSVEAANAGNMPAVAIGGVIAAVAALF